jgi:hypothetical protein
MLANLPPSAGIVTATNDVAKSWLNQDPASATQWINTLPQGNARDGAVTQIISVISKNDPAAAYTWAASITNQGNRNRQIVNLTTQWSAQNPAAAATAAQSALSNLTGLTVAQRTNLQKVVDKAAAP